MDWEAFALVVSGTMRSQVLLALDHPLTPSELRKKLKRSYSQLSDVLSLLHAHHLVVCLNESATKGRLYQRTAAGEAVAIEIRLLRDVQIKEKSKILEEPEVRLNNP